MRQAAALLAQTDLPLKQIVQRCGIAYIEYLSYLFKKSFGMSPGEYRKRHARSTQTPL
ncbi:MAG: helix-turn-helix domain-containing protein [Tepidisphaeraceae bacterium]